MSALFASAAFMSGSMAMASTVTTMVVSDRAGAGWAGGPATAGIVGTGLGALLLTRVTARLHRRAGLLIGYLIATIGGVAAATTVTVTSTDVVGLSIGMLLLGLGNAAAQLSRYAGADLYPAHRRGVAIGIIVSAGAVGAVGGPLLLAPAHAAATDSGWIGDAGPLLLVAVITFCALAAAWRSPGLSARSAGGVRVSLRRLLRMPAGRSAIAVMATAQVVMGAVMTATPVDMHLHHRGLSAIGVILSTHTLGMFALATLTGRLVDRYGPRPVMFAGLSVLSVGSGAAALAGATSLLGAALFLLGYGWNLCFVGGSALLSREVPAAEQAGIEGAVDGAIWGSAAVAVLACTPLLAHVGFGLLAGIAAIVPVFALAVLGYSRTP